MKDIVEAGSELDSEYEGYVDDLVDEVWYRIENEYESLNDKLRDISGNISSGVVTIEVETDLFKTKVEYNLKDLHLDGDDYEFQNAVDLVAEQLLDTLYMNK